MDPPGNAGSSISPAALVIQDSQIGVTCGRFEGRRGRSPLVFLALEYLSLLSHILLQQGGVQCVLVPYPWASWGV